MLSASPMLTVAGHLLEHADGVRGCGRSDGLLRLANAWHARVTADEVASHGFHPEYIQPLAAYWCGVAGRPVGL